MSTRTYDQACSVARGLDLLGDRWTLLIVRDLLVRPRRYGDLLEGLPGIGTNLLADRLKRLEEHGIVERGMVPPPAPAGAVAYWLTAKGAALEPVVIALARWTLAWSPPARPDVLDLPEWNVIALRAVFRADEALGVHETYQFEIGDTAFSARVDDRSLETALGRADAPDLTFRCSVKLFRAIANGEVSVLEARWDGPLEIVGSDAALDRLLRIFRPPTPVTS